MATPAAPTARAQQIPITPTIAGLQRLVARGFQPRGILDIGANSGQWSAIARVIFQDAPIVMIEAQPVFNPQLKSMTAALGNASHHIALLGEEIGMAPFHIVQFPGSTGSSLLRENTSHPIQTVMQDMVTLDYLMRNSQEFYDFIKLDVQGAELRVLQGGLQVLGRAEFVLLEVSLLPYNNEAPLAAEVMAWMQAHGFMLYDILDQIRLAQSDILLQADFLFARENSLFRPAPPYA